ncbi:hypothetical protein [Pseudomonas putida]|uniref:hypothetical protein n=1 Tax=Pseudomonas putida TaxID=303 RepID=UPI0012BB4E0C|nr:hypothetical protein [Pseudomonas putida]
MLHRGRAMIEGNQWEPVSGIFWQTAPSILDGTRWLPDLDGSSFFITIFGALVGAFAGAWAAQRSARNSKRRDELVAEIRVVNAGVILSHTVFVSTLSARQEYIDPARERYDAEKIRYLKAVEMPPESGQVCLNLELQYFPESPTQVSQLQSLVIQQGSTPALRSVTALVQSNNLFAEALRLRNEYIGRFERREIPSKFKYQDVYFGLVTQGGHNQQFSSAVEAVSFYSDDVLYFSKRLCEHLGAHAEKLKKELGRFSAERVGIVQFDFSAAEENGVCPSRERYKDWEDGYVEVDRRPRWMRWWN